MYAYKYTTAVLLYIAARVGAFVRAQISNFSFEFDLTSSVLVHDSVYSSM